MLFIMHSKSLNLEKKHIFATHQLHMNKKERIEARNRDLIRKFYELYDVKRIRLEDTILQLEKQFYIDKDYIYALIFYNKKNNQYYESLLQQSQPA